MKEVERGAGVRLSFLPAVFFSRRSLNRDKTRRNRQTQSRGVHAGAGGEPRRPRASPRRGGARGAGALAGRARAVPPGAGARQLGRSGRGGDHAEESVLSPATSAPPRPHPGCPARGPAHVRPAGRALLLAGGWVSGSRRGQTARGGRARDEEEAAASRRRRRRRRGSLAPGAPRGGRPSLPGQLEALGLPAPFPAPLPPGLRLLHGHPAGLLPGLPLLSARRGTPSLPARPAAVFG